MAKRSKVTRHEKLDIELFDLNKYKRIQAENDGVQTLVLALDEFKENFSCRDTDHEPNFKGVDLETKQAMHEAITKLSALLDEASNQLYRNAHKAIKGLN